MRILLAHPLLVFLVWTGVVFAQGGGLDGSGGGIMAFSSDRSGNYEIYLMNADGSNQMRITDGPGGRMNSAWSPDGMRLAFNSDECGASEIYIMDVVDITNGVFSDPVQITSLGGCLTPSWSPDGARIVFDRFDGGTGSDLYIVNVDGTGLTQITETPEAEFHPSWSPDGARIAFTLTDFAASTQNIVVMNADGSDPQALTNNDESYYPAWSPDGTHIAFNSVRAGQQGVDIAVIQSDGSDWRWITTYYNHDEFPTWSPDRSRIAYESDRNGREKIYTTNADGTDTQRITNTAFNDGFPNWRPTESPSSVDPAERPADGFHLYSNFPNPFNPETTIRYSLSEGSYIVVEVLDINGKVVRTLVAEKRQAGMHSVVWDGRDDSGHPVGTGIYVYIIQTDSHALTKQSRKMLLVK